MSAARALYLPARAKLNLVLRIVGRRDDGYHLLDSLFHTLQLHDDVVVARFAVPPDLAAGRVVDGSVADGSVVDGGAADGSVIDGIAIVVHADEPRLLVPADERNLAVKALRLWRQALPVELARDLATGLRIHLHKRIPNGGGLGGGSSNAAAVLRLANRLLDDPLSDTDLYRLGCQLGADVPFFLRGGSQWGRGIGTELHAAEPFQGHFVLLLPPYGCGTVEVYKNHAAQWRADPAQATVATITVPNNRDAAVGIGFCNELERAAEQVRPELGRLRQAVVEAGYARVRMSGSGSTLFVAVADAESAQQCQRELRHALAQTEHHAVQFVVTTSGPTIDVDQPSSQLPVTFRRRPPDPFGGAVC